MPEWYESAQSIRPEGTGSLGVLMVGESPGANEQAERLPFRPYAQAGSVLERAIRLAGLDRQQFALWNLLGSRPPRDWLDGAPWEQESIEFYRPAFEDVLHRYSPKVILALGAVPCRTLTGMTGRKQGISNLRGFPLPALRYPGVIVVPSYHPSFIARGASHLLGVLIHDILKAVRIARDGVPTWTPQTQVVQDDEAMAIVQRYPADVPFAYDIETIEGDEKEEADSILDSKIVSFQFALEAGRGYYMAWNDATRAFVAWLFRQRRPSVGHNSWRFDDALLYKHGVSGYVGDDTRWMWHHLQPDLPADLQTVASFYNWPCPWKHLDKADPVLYGAMDACATWHIHHHMQAELAKLTGYDKLVRPLEPVLRDMSKRGIPVSLTKHAELRQRVEADNVRLDAEMQSLVPDECKPWHPKEGYKRDPKQITPDMRRHTFDGVERWIKLMPFKPSIQGMKRYASLRGHKLPRNSDDGVSFDKTALEKLIKRTGDPLYRVVDSIRKNGVLLNNMLPNWEPGSDGRVHPTFGYGPATGQLASTRPNAQNAPKHTSDGFRGIIEAPSGFTLMEFDYKSFHALTLGWLAGDSDYMRMARMDVHSFLASYLVDEPVRPDLPDDELRERLAYIRRKYKIIRDTKAKRAILGYGFGMGARKLYMMNEESFDGLKDAQRTLDMLDVCFPRLKLFRDDIRMQAHKQGKLVSRWGFVRYFWDVLRYQRGKWTGGSDAEAAIAFLPANTAFGYIREAMLQLVLCSAVGRYGLINQVHDSLVFLCPNALVEEALATVPGLMSQPHPVLDGFKAEVEASVGKSWDKMEAIR